MFLKRDEMDYGFRYTLSFRDENNIWDFSEMAVAVKRVVNLESSWGPMSLRFKIKYFSGFEKLKKLSIFSMPGNFYECFEPIQCCSTNVFDVFSGLYFTYYIFLKSSDIELGFSGMFAPIEDFQFLIF